MLITVGAIIPVGWTIIPPGRVIIPIVRLLVVTSIIRIGWIKRPGHKVVVVIRIELIIAVGLKTIFTVRIKSEIGSRHINYLLSTYAGIGSL